MNIQLEKVNLFLDELKKLEAKHNVSMCADTYLGINVLSIYTDDLEYIADVLSDDTKKIICIKK